MKKRIFGVLLALCMLLTACAGGGGAISGGESETVDRGWIDRRDTAWYEEAAEGTGESADNPYVLTTAEQLAGLAALTFGEDGSKTAFPGKYIRLGADIDLSGLEWTPIGRNLDNPFRGHFDGAGYAITGLTMTSGKGEEGDADAACGLFGVLEGGSVSDLTVAGSISVSDDRAIYMILAGGIAGAADGAQITGCVSRVSLAVTGTRPTAALYGGGIVGYAPESAVADCRVEQDVTLSFAAQGAKEKQNGILFCGGIAGYLAAYEAGARISGCSSGAQLSVSVPEHGDADHDHLAYGGGIVGYAAAARGLSAVVADCVSTGSVTVENSQPVPAELPAGRSGNKAFAGGVAGCAEGGVFLTRCTGGAADGGTRVAASGDAALAGGIAGAFVGLPASDPAEVSSSASADAGGGELSAAGAADAGTEDSSGAPAAGRIEDCVGYAAVSVRGCPSESLSGLEGGAAAPAGAAERFAGGIAGRADAVGISGCTALAAEVTAERSPAGGEAWAGAVLGCGEGTSLSGCRYLDDGTLRIAVTDAQGETLRLAVSGQKAAGIYAASAADPAGSDIPDAAVGCVGMTPEQAREEGLLPAGIPGPGSEQSAE